MVPGYFVQMYVKRFFHWAISRPVFELIIPFDFEEMSNICAEFIKVRNFSAELFDMLR